MSSVTKPSDQSDLSKFATDVLPTYVPDDGPLTAKQVLVLRKDATKHLPKGKLLSRDALFVCLE